MIVVRREVKTVKNCLIKEGVMGSIFYESTDKKAYFYEDWDICFPEHIHKQLEIFYLLEGEVKITLNHNKILMKQGDVLVVFPNMIHGYESLCHTRFYIGLADPEVLGSNGGVILKNNCLNPVNPVLAFSPQLGMCMEMLAGECEKGKPVKRECRLYGYFNVVADLLLEGLDLRISESGSEDVLHPVLNYILSHYQEEITLESTARSVGISKYYLSRIFSEKMGYSFPGYLAMLRTELAKELLETSDRGMTDIAYMCGFKSECSFFRNFKYLTGTTPLQYKKRKETKRHEDYQSDFKRIPSGSIHRPGGE